MADHPKFVRTTQSTDWVVCWAIQDFLAAAARVGVNSIFSIQFQFQFRYFQFQFQFQFHYSQKVSIPVPIPIPEISIPIPIPEISNPGNLHSGNDLWAFFEIDYNYTDKVHVYKIIVINTISLISLVNWL